MASLREMLALERSYPMAEVRETLALAFLKSKLPTDEACRAMGIIDEVLAAPNTGTNAPTEGEKDG